MPDCAGCEHIVAVGTSDPDLCDLQCPSPLDVTPARAAVEKWLETRIDPYLGPCIVRRVKSLGRPVSRNTMLLNAGELADSLGFSPEENPHVPMLLDLFSDSATNPHGHNLLLVTKAGLEATEAHVDGRKPSTNVILSWSIGNLYGAPWEPYWETASEREEAAAWAARQGWRGGGCDLVRGWVVRIGAAALWLIVSLCGELEGPVNGQPEEKGNTNG